MSLDHIDDLCDRFEAALRRGEPARIEDYLQEVAPEQRAKLFRELVEIEVEIAVQSVPEHSTDEAPVFKLQKSFKERFPDDGDLVDSVVRRIVKLRQIGDYEILEELGHGGMGIVYRARQKLLNQVVAIKILSQTLLDDAQAVARFRREMQLIGGLNHPNIVRALNAGESDGAHYLVMEYVDGITLQRLCDTIRKDAIQKEKRSNNDPVDSTDEFPSELPPEFARTTVRSGESGSASKSQAVRVADTTVEKVVPLGAACEAIRQAALGLQHAHQFGLVHRDIKPANLMLDRTGTIKILDLGLGKFLAEQRPSTESESLTMVGTTIGTIDYISPEQCENAGDVDIRADIYSLGCTMYFLITGRAPYSGSRYDTTRKKLMAHIVGEIPNLQKVLDDVPNELEDVLEKMLAKEPAERYQTPIEVAEALEPFASLEDLQDMIGGRFSSGVRRAPGSTSRISGTSHTRQAASIKKPESLYVRNLRTLSKIVLAIVLLVMIVATGTIVGIKHLIRTAGIEESRAGRADVSEMPVDGVPLPTRLDLQREQKEAIRVDVALLPGLNGSWWFDETPWLLPFVRELLQRKIMEADDPASVLGNRPQRYYDPDVSAVQQWLWEIVQQYREELAPWQRQIVDRMKEFCDSSGTDDDATCPYQDSLEAFLEANPTEASSENPRTGANLHTLALLEHRLASKRNDRELAVTAMARYNEAMDRYRREAQEKTEDGVASPSALRSRQLEFLCLADSARLEYLATGNYRRAVDKFESVLKQRQTDERLGGLFLAELRAAQGALSAEAGFYDDSLFTRGRDMLVRSPAGEMHPLVAQLGERYAWSLLDQWKVGEAEEEFERALLIRWANLQNSKNRFATIYIFHDRHGRALSMRYKGNGDQAVEEYRRTLADIDKELENCRSLSASSSPESPAIHRYHLNLRERAANTRERLADCLLYGGAASGQFSRGRLGEAAKLYGDAAVFYQAEGVRRTMLSKQAIILILQGEIDQAEEILKNMDAQKTTLLGNQLRSELVRQVADALLVYRKANSDEGRKKGLSLIRQFLVQFTIPGNPIFLEATRRENLELRLFCAEFLVDEALDADSPKVLAEDLGRLMQPIGFFMDRPESRPYLRRIVDTIVRVTAKMSDALPEDSPAKQAHFQSIVRILGWMRLRNDTEAPSQAPSSDTTASQVVFFLDGDPSNGFVLYYPLEIGRNGSLYRLPLTRSMVKSGARREGTGWTLDLRLLALIREDLGEGRAVMISWNDRSSWPRPEDALQDADWPFGDQLRLDGTLPESGPNTAP